MIEHADVERPLVNVVEDDPDTNRAVCGLAAAHGWEARGYPDAASFLAGYDGGRPGCIVLDLRLPDASGMQVVEALTERGDHVAPIVFITGHGDLQTAVTAMKSDLVCDFIEKPFEPADLLRVIEGAVDRDRELVGGWRTWRSTRAKLERLSDRERQVLDALMEGKSNKQIAIELDVSHKTVSTHRTHVLEKFGCQSIVDVARLLEAPPPGPGAVRA
jgi:FixJ family two-component response regulator